MITSAESPKKTTLWAWTVATFFGAGFGKPGPGTWGSVAAVLLWAAYARFVSSAPSSLLVTLLAGIALTLLLGSHANWRHALIALILFRLFDITKPFPVRRLEDLPEGWGIVLDDVGAGLYALGIASLLHLWI